MAASTLTPITGSYTQLAAEGGWTSVQNRSNCDIDVIYSATEPLSTDLGFRFKPLDAFTPDSFGDGTIWCRVVTGNTSGLVTINS